MKLIKRISQEEKEIIKLMISADKEIEEQKVKGEYVPSEQQHDPRTLDEMLADWELYWDNNFAA